MHPAHQHHLLLGRIPQRIVSHALFQLLLAVDDRPPVSRMLGQGALRPGFQTLHGVVGRVEAHEIDCQLAPDDDLFEKRLLRPGGRVAALYRERNRERPHMPEVQIGRKPARAMLLGAVARLGIVRQAMTHEFPECPQPLLASTPPARNRLN